MEENRDKQIEESLREFIDERYLKILRLRVLLKTGKDDKKTGDYLMVKENNIVNKIVLTFK